MPGNIHPPYEVKMPLGGPYSRKFMASLLLAKTRVALGCCLAHGGSDLQGAWLRTLHAASSSARITVNVCTVPLAWGFYWLLIFQTALEW